MKSAEMAEVYDVAIVGFGPSGAVAAGLLGQAGVRTYVCDRSTEVYDKPRAIALDHEIMRVFQHLGVAEAVEPWVEPFTPSEYYGVDGQLIKRFTTVAPPFPLGYTPSLVFTQPPVEAILRDRARALPSVTVDLGVTLEGLEQDAGGVTLALRHAMGAAKAIRARYVIGCDGASSLVRTLLGIELDDLAFDEPWLVVDVRVNERGQAKLPAVSVQYCDPDRPATYVIGPGNHRRWEISLNEGEDLREAATEAGAWRLLSRWLTPEDGTLWRQASYRFHALVAHDWRRGRAFLAGDAAHQQPPFLGQGMCQGIRDVANLAWKLAAVLEGHGGEGLLDSYGVERSRHVRDLTGRIKAIGAVICERDRDLARMRDRRLLAEAGGPVRDEPRQNVLPRLEEGLLAVTPHPANGTLFPQPWILDVDGRRRRLDSLTGTGWRLVIVDDWTGPEAVAALPGLALVRVGAGGLEEADGVLAAWFKTHACSAALVRPDNYVYGVGTRPDDWAAHWVALERQMA
ncbi:3-(3-hydroxy-phenyl)propionate hydroxylase [Nitrospirillum amazonense]|uniref:3-(3-hydroxy-phenyl)propionate hydroxylase n=1 Tax=Nitrospirillum amazonense TaxID=28077 RepID=A0A560JHT0_9PROT|nr:bifunctional 3-(3-hydroxy-phenyl)propionate/3-hydroxycinnamic acid hydroxylase [Nitrospirillum amazonense]TWB70712.1 3-(3-hydroxy-phenyl)propionate hydroxylase [Nitrospirillum amazonense]